MRRPAGCACWSCSTTWSSTLSSTGPPSLLVPSSGRSGRCTAWRRRRTAITSPSFSPASASGSMAWTSSRTSSSFASRSETQVRLATCTTRSRACARRQRRSEGGKGSVPSRPPACRSCWSDAPEFTSSRRTTTFPRPPPRAASSSSAPARSALLLWRGTRSGWCGRAPASERLISPSTAPQVTTSALPTSTQSCWRFHIPSCTSISRTSRKVSPPSSSSSSARLSRRRSERRSKKLSRAPGARSSACRPMGQARSDGLREQERTIPSRNEAP
mmetsp:Transcript_41918/g.132156  ORF Transcript_41918/g.132156 Transcript_41918/m.132156 type:complete len:273 (+) Transcript_41918:4486-5304(+)